jgi:hypothetical protein
MPLKKILLLLVLMTMAPMAKEVAIVKSLTGVVEVKRVKKITPLKVGSRLNEGDLIITKAKSSIGFIFDDGTRIALGSKSIFLIKKFVVNPEKDEYDVDLEMKKGTISFSSGKIGKLAPKAVKFHIPEGTIGIRGTKFLVEVD